MWKANLHVAHYRRTFLVFLSLFSICWDIFWIYNLWSNKTNLKFFSSSNLYLICTSIRPNATRHLVKCLSYDDSTMVVSILKLIQFKDSIAVTILQLNLFKKLNWNKWIFFYEGYDWSIDLIILADKLCVLVEINWMKEKSSINAFCPIRNEKFKVKNAYFPCPFLRHTDESLLP